MMDVLRRIKWAFRYNGFYLRARRWWSVAPLASTAGYEWHGEPRIGFKTALLACYADGEIPENTLTLAKLWEEAGFRTNIIAAVDKPFLPNVDYPVMMRQNLGYDFGSWSHAISVLDLKKTMLVALVNDSVVPGPKYRDMIVQAELAQNSGVGAVESKECRRHIQTFFMMFKPWGLRRKKWLSVKSFDRQNTIELYELLAMKDHGIDPIFPAVDLRNPSIRRWQDFKDYFVKRQLIRENPYNDDLSEIPEYARI